MRDFHKQLFVLIAKQGHLGHIRHAQQFQSGGIGKNLEFGVVETVALQRINHAIDIAKIVIEKRSLYALGQGAAHVANLLAHLVPDIGHLGGFG